MISPSPGVALVGAEEKYAGEDEAEGGEKPISTFKTRTCIETRTRIFNLRLRDENENQD